MRRTAPALLVLLALAACNEPASPTPRASLKVGLSDAGCAVTGSPVPAGAVTLELTNQGTDAYDEVYVLKGTRIEGEKEGLGRGRSGSLTLTLAPGSYAVHCPGARTDQPFTVTAGSAAPVSDGAAAEAATAYAAYVKQQVAEQVVATRRLTDAVRRGDLAAAAAAYADARVARAGVRSRRCTGGHRGARRRSASWSPRPARPRCFT